MPRTPRSPAAAHALGGVGAAFCVRASPIHGNGLFATRDIPKNALVTFYDGARVSWEVARRSEPSYMRGVVFGHEAVDGLRAPEAGRGAGSFANHAPRHPNAVYWVRDDVVWIKAARPIAAGEEITVSYGRGYWRR